MAKKANKVKRARSRWQPVKAKAEDNTGEVITKPNQTMSVRDILFKNTQGMTYDNYKTPYYEEQATLSSQSLNKIQEMEPVEKLQYLKEVSLQVKDLQNKIKTHEAEKAAAAQAAAEKAIIQESKTAEGNE
jgi:hypothetical protein